MGRLRAMILEISPYRVGRIFAQYLPKIKSKRENISG
jgi:hypothetical protein